MLLPNIYFLFYTTTFFIVNISIIQATLCGCKKVRPCYKEMIDTLKYRDEEACVEDAAIGVSTIMIFLKALKQYCGDYITVNSASQTFEGRNLYEVVVSISRSGSEGSVKPVIIVEAGQTGGTEPVGLSLYLIEQLIACHEYNELLQKVNWVILPASNPDGMEFSRFNRVLWKKNVKVANNGLSFGVDISRNFDSQWASCERVESGFSAVYPGPSSGSENETIFMKNVLQKYKPDIKAYLSLRRDGHAIMFPFAYTKNLAPDANKARKAAADIAAKVNQRAGSIQLFLNDTIYNINGKPHCGHSVDFAHDQGITYAFEMRVFVGSDNRLMTKFHNMPRGYENSLRAGYFSGIKELFNIVVNDKSKPANNP